MLSSTGILADSYATNPVRTGLQMWTDGADGSTITEAVGRITLWTDKSGNGRHWTCAANGPGYTTGLINGLKAPNHLATVTVPMTVPAFASSYTSAEMFAVLRVDAVNDGAHLYGFSPDPAFVHYPYSDGNGNIYDSWGSSIRRLLGKPTLTTLATPHIYRVSTAPGSYLVWINDEMIFSSGTNTVAFRNTVFEYGQTNNIPTGLMGEFIMYNRVLSNGERTQVMSYLKTKWGIA